MKYLKSGLVFIIGGFFLLGIQTKPTAQQVDPGNFGQGQPNTANNKKNGQKAKYAPGRFIVKFKSEGPNAVNGDAQYLLESNRPFQAAVTDGLDSLDKLNQKHKVKNARSLFIDRHGLTTADAMQKQNSIQQLSKVMHHARNQRAPANAVMPDLSNVYVLEVTPESDIEAIAREYQSDPHVEYAQPDYLMETNMVPNDPYYSSVGSWGQPYDDLWGLKNIKAEQAWDITQGEGVVVAVVDTGLDYNHPDIAANVWTNLAEIPNNGIDDDGNGFVDDVQGWDFANNDNNPIDGHGHGTHVSGTIAAIGNNNLGIIGVAPKARIMPVKGLGDGGNGFSNWLAQAIVYAAQNGADVINNSWYYWGGWPSDPVIEDAVRMAYGLGAVVVFCAGNDSADVASYSPQNMTDSKPIVVAASDHLDQRSDFSNFGTLIDVAAPGGDSSTGDGNNKQGRNILSLRAQNTDMYNDGLGIVGDNYYRSRGTSMAAPHAVGVAALVLSHQPAFTNEEVRQVLRASADDVGSPGFDIKTGAGRLNAARALLVSSTLQVKITSPSSGTTFSPADGMVTITGTVTGADFSSYELAYGIGVAPDMWIPIDQPVSTPVSNGVLGTWAIGNLTPNIYVVMLTATSHSSFRFSDLTKIMIKIPSTPITTDPYSQEAPAISGDKIVWQDSRNGNWDIYLYDLSTNTERQITTDPYPYSQEAPAISGDKIVWQDSRNGNWDIYLYDLSTNTERQITTDPDSQEAPAISGDRIVWQDSRNDKWSGRRDIYLYDLSTNTERQITTDPFMTFISQEAPAISGDKIVWQDSRNSGYSNINWDIYLYDLSTNTERQITTDPDPYRSQKAPAISGDKIVWQDSGNGNNPTTFWNIYLYDLSTNTERRITTDPYPYRRQEAPAISGDKIVWQDYSGDINGNTEIYLYDLSTNTERWFTTDPERQWLPAISGDRIVWQDLRNGNWDIYYFRLNDPPALSPIGNKTVNEGQLLSFTVSATDPDGDALTYSATGLPSGASLSGQTFSWIPDYSQAGIYDVMFIASDGVFVDSETITVTVTDVPNLLANPDFEQDKQNWSFPANGSIDTVVFRSGTKSAKLVGTGTITSTPRVAVIAGKSYLVAGWVKTQDIANTATTAYGVRGRIQWYNTSGTLLSSQNLCGLKGTKDWARYSKTFTAPASAVTARIQLQIVGSGTTGTAWFDSLAISP